MGVTGLWNLIEPCGKVVPVDTLENKVLAIDISIWLHQVVKGFQDNKGGSLPNAHLLGLFHRLCKLMYYRIRPVFVFDGKVPQLKRDTIAKRNQSRNKLLNEADRIQNLILQSLAKEKIVQQALGPNAAQILASPTKPNKPAKPEADDIFKLPEIPSTILDDELSTTGDYTTVSETDSSFDENSASNYYNCNLQAIDVNSPHFKNLPADVRHEVLVDIKETRKQSSWGRLHELPAHSDDFSTFQMKRLLKRRQVQVSLEDAEKEMGGRSLTLSELQTFFTEEGILEPSSVAGTKHIASDENTRYLLVKDLKKTLETNKAEEEVKEPQPSTSAAHTSTLEPITEAKLVEEYDEELAMAIQMSLEDTNVYNEKDYDCDTVKLNEEQRKLFKNSAKTLARDYLIEYGGMNDEEIDDMLEKTQRKEDDVEIDASFQFKYTDPLILNSDLNIKTLEMKADDVSEIKINNAPIQENTEEDVGYMSSGSGSDEDLIEVPISNGSKESSLTKSIEFKKMEIVVDITKELPKDDDLFADVFCENSLKNDVTETADKSKDSIKQHVSELGATEVVEANDDIKPDLKPIDVLKISIAKPVSKLEISNILEDLKKEAANISKLTLDSIKLNNSQIIEISDSDGDYPQKSSTDLCKESKNETNEKFDLKTPPVEEIIMIPDDGGEPSSILKTPKKAKIDEFFESKYFIKRTPEKSKEADENIAKVKSPFFVNRSPKTPKTPKSSEKKHLHGNQNSTDCGTSSTPSRTTSVAKTLFDKPTDDNMEDIVPIVVDPIAEAAASLKEKKTHEELIDLASDLAKEKRELEMERNRQDRMGTSITEKMNSDCMQLLRLFGIPYIVAPMEAEAQCAFLDSMNLTDGTITDDSDIWLFGGQTVYKNFFNQQKHVLEFKSEVIEKSFRVDRKKLIQLAILVGSDYTTGIHGIGAVTALEILAMFPPTDQVDGETTEIMSALSSLRKFRDWYKNSKVFGSAQKMSLKKKLKNIELGEGFPSMAIVEAYLSPTVDKNRDKFTWGTLDIETICEYTKKYLGWTRSKTDDILSPVLKRINERKHQSSIKNYFGVKSALAIKEVSVSKRVKKAIERMSEDYKSDEESAKPAKIRRQRKAKSGDETAEGNKPKTTRRKATSELSLETTAAKPKRGKKKQKEPDTESLPSSSTASSSRTSIIPKIIINNPKTTEKNINIPNPNPTIPQREKDLVEMNERKAKAAEILRKTVKTRSK